MILPFLLIVLFGWLQRDLFSENQRLQRLKSARSEVARASRYNPKQEARALVRNGTKLSAEEVKRLEGRAAEDTLSAGGRARLIGYYGGARRRHGEESLAHARHVLWFIENQPESLVLKDHTARLEPRTALPAYIRAKELWLKLLEESPENLLLKANAAEMFQFGDSELSIKILKDAEELDPENGEWARKIGYVHGLGKAGLSRAKMIEKARLSFEAYERSMPLLPLTKKQAVISHLVDLAYTIGDKTSARQYAAELLEGDQGTDRTRPSFGLGGHSHVAETVLGLLALDEGDVSSAKNHLIASVTFPKRERNPRLPAFPFYISQFDFRLALRLLEKGEREVVRMFVEEGRPYLGHRAKYVPEWLESLENGFVPNFEGL